MEILTKISGKLVEGCVWDEKRNILYFIDIECRKIYALEPESKELEQIELPEYVGCILLEERGTVVAALTDGLYRVDFCTKSVKKIMDIDLPQGIRFNDGKCDPAGRLWVGTMAITQDTGALGAGELLCIQKEKIMSRYKEYTIPNGLAWDKERPYFYHVDTSLKRIERYKIEKGCNLVQRKTVIDLHDEKGSPDGMCMDCEGNLWAAMWGGGQIIGVNSRSGEIIGRIEVPDIYPSCCTFGGADMDRLFITTARDEEGKGGEVYVQKMDVKGVRAERYVQ